jgi:hypothetical protein
MRGLGPHSNDDFLIAIIAGLLAWMITLAFKIAISGSA